MRIKKISAVLLLFIFLSVNTRAQETTVFSEANRAYKSGKDLFDKGVFSGAMHQFEKALELIQPLNEPEYEALLMDAELGLARSAVRLDMPEGEKLMLDFIRKYQPDPVANGALLDVANFFYASKKYDQAIEYFNKIPASQLTKEQRAELQFKTGYAYFVQKKFPQAKSKFVGSAENNDSEFYFPSNYYLGLCEFFAGNYEAAVRQFRLVERDRKYRGEVPYYIAQIYFAEKDYDQLISYAEPKISDRTFRKQKELNQLVGQAYFEKGDYARALPYLEYYAERSGKLTAEAFYQLAYTQYQQQKYKAAAANFAQLDNEKNELGQNALYHLGICRLKQNDKTSARNAFAQASRMNFARELQQDATISYAKLSYELRFDSEAITALQSIPSDSPYYNEAQGLMGDIFLNTRDYARALQIIEAMPSKTAQLREAYQKVAYLRGLQLYRDGKVGEAKSLFRKAIDNPVDAKTTALSNYWLGDIAHFEKKYPESIRYMESFLTKAKGLTDLPDEASLYTASYTQGYNYQKQKQYAKALGYFQDASTGISRNRATIKNKRVKEDILGDATLRTGDGYFKRNKYDEAIRFYNSAIQNRYAGYEYALYQKAIIEGLRNNPQEKLDALENLIKNHPKSEFADDALYQTALTNVEVGRINGAVSSLQQLVRDYPNSTLVNQAYLRLGLITYNQGNTTAAIEYYKRIFANNPDPVQATDALAALREIYVEDLGDPDGYFTFLNTLPGYNVEDSEKDDLKFDAAESKYENAEYDRAITGYTSYLRSYPNGKHVLVALFHRAESNAVLLKYGEALTDYEAVAAKGASQYYAKSLKKGALIAYNYAKDFEKSYDLYTKWEQVAETDTDRFEAQLGAMRAAYRSGNTSAVRSTAQKVAQNPNASPEERAVASFYVAKSDFDNKDYDNALTSFNEVLTVGASNEQTAEARYLVAYIYYIKRDFDTAADLANRALQGNSGYPYWVARSMILLADSFAGKGDLFDARAVLEAMLEQYDGDPALILEAQTKLRQYNEQSQGNSRIERPSLDTFMEEPEGN
ncbi:MAG: tetratricopeptide (TPR) repeat protein [Saprospiraceae bacterium]|jgi:tetratricopeptide (TPR) repeat protein